MAWREGRSRLCVWAAAAVTRYKLDVTAARRGGGACRTLPRSLSVWTGREPLNFKLLQYAIQLV